MEISHAQFDHRDRFGMYAQAMTVIRQCDLTFMVMPCRVIL